MAFVFEYEALYIIFDTYQINNIYSCQYLIVVLLQYLNHVFHNLLSK